MATDTDPPYGFDYQYRTCLWCGADLPDDATFFDSDLCGRLFAEQLAVRGLRLHAEELVNVNG